MFLLNPFFSIKSHRTLLVQLIKRNIESRYKGHTFGILWTIIQPLVMLTVYTFVFSVVFKAKWGGSISESQGAFAIIMFCGMSLFNLFSESVVSSCPLIINNPNYVKKIIFPLELLPIAQVTSTFIIGLAWIFLLVLGVLIIFNQITWTALFFPFLLIPLYLVSLGVSFLVSSLTVYLKDMQYIISVLIQILFFLTPIFYPINAVPQKFRVFLLANPLTQLIEDGRKLLIFGETINISNYCVSLFFSFLIFYFGYYWFLKVKKGFADVL